GQDAEVDMVAIAVRRAAISAGSRRGGRQGRERGAKEEGEESPALPGCCQQAANRIETLAIHVCPSGSPPSDEFPIRMLLVAMQDYDSAKVNGSRKNPRDSAFLGVAMVMLPAHDKTERREGRRVRRAAPRHGTESPVLCK